MSSLRARIGLIAAISIPAAFILSGCEDKVVVIRPKRATTETADAETQVVAREIAEESSRVPREYNDDDFVEKDVDSRDPFRSFVTEFRGPAVRDQQRTVIMPDTAVDEMRLMSIVRGGLGSSAMFIDPSGVGHVVRPQNYVGRPEVIQVGGSEGMPVTLNWRVARIRSDEVVLTREDPNNPDGPPLTRVVRLHDAESHSR